MSRLRFNNVSNLTSGTITLSSGGTTATFGAAPAFTTIAAPDIAVIIVEPDTANEEVIYVTAYTAAATTATVLRGQEGTASVAHSSAAWVHGPTAADYKTAASRMFATANFR